VTAALAGSVDAQASRSAAAITLRWSVQTGSTDVAWRALAANYMKANPNVEIKIEYYQVATYQQALLSQLQAGNAADIIFGNGGSGQLYGFLELARAGRLANLAGSPWVKRIPPSARPFYMIGKRVYGLPVGNVFVGPEYDKTAFANLNLKVPETFAQLLNICRVARANGKAAISIAGTAFPNIGIWMMMISASSVYSDDPKWNQKRLAGQVTFQNSGWRTTVNRFKAMVDARCFQDGAAGGTIPGNFTNIGTGRTLMMGAPAGVIPSILAVNPNAKIGVFPFPGATKAQTRALVGLTDGLAVNAASPNKAEAIKFLTFVAREGQSRIWPTVARGTSIVDGIKGKVPAEAALFAPYLKANKTVVFPNLEWPNGDIYITLGALGQGLLTGQTTVDEVLRGLDQKWGR
jgi:raffinose/stachyose/melibiose transport system substrate-binding protein